MFNPSGLSVPSLKINFISCCLRPMLLFQTTDHDVIQRMGGGVEMFSYGKPKRPVYNTAEVLTETFPQSPSGLSDV